VWWLLEIAPGHPQAALEAATHRKSQSGAKYRTLPANSFEF